MRLHLLRHAHAGDAEAWSGPDATRPLTDKGRKQAQRLGRFLAEREFRPDAMVTSPKVRAAQTAEITGDLLGLVPVVDDRLAGAVDLPTVEAILGDHGDPASIVLVGHDPDLSDLVAILCGAAGVPMAKGAIACIEVERPLTVGAGTLRWLVAPELLKGG